MLIPLAIVAAAWVGASLSWLVPWSERRLHVALALSTGTFLGAVFLHLMPDVAARAAPDAHSEGAIASHVADPHHAREHAAEEHAQASGGGHEHGDYLLWLCVLGGALLVHLVEALCLRTTEREDAGRHRSVGLITAVGVSVHAAAAGLGLSALETGGALGTTFVAAFLAHKAFESFALVNVFLLAEIPRLRVCALVLASSLVTPACLLAGNALLSKVEASVLHVVTALATGTFLYVCLVELLPEVFHHRGDDLAKSVLLVAGVALSVLFVELGA